MPTCQDLPKIPSHELHTQPPRHNTAIPIRTVRASHRLPWRLVVIIFAGVIALPANISAQDRILHISTAFGPPISTEDGRGFFDLIIKHACARLGYRVNIDHPQAERALMLVNSGINDGDGPRADTLDNFKNYPNLIRVEEKLMNLDFVAFTRTPSLSIHDWDSLTGHNVAVVTGWKIIERRLSFLSNLVKVKDVEHALLLLKYGRTDVAILDRYSGVKTARKIGLKSFHVSSPPLYSRAMYLYLNKRDIRISKKLAATLHEMKQDGTYRRIYKETLSNVIAQYKRVKR